MFSAVIAEVASLDGSPCGGGGALLRAVRCVAGLGVLLAPPYFCGRRGERGERSRRKVTGGSVYTCGAPRGARPAPPRGRDSAPPRYFYAMHSSCCYSIGVKLLF